MDDAAIIMYPGSIIFANGFYYFQSGFARQLITRGMHTSRPYCSNDPGYGTRSTYASAWGHRLSIHELSNR